MNTPTESLKPSAFRLALLTLAFAIGVAFLSYLLVNHNGRATYMVQEGRLPGLIAVGLALLMLVGLFPLAMVLMKRPRFPLLLPAAAAHLVALVGGFAVAVADGNARASLSVNDNERPLFARMGAEMLASAHSVAIIVSACVGTLSLVVLSLGVLRVYSISGKFGIAAGTTFRLKVMAGAVLVWLLLRLALAGTVGLGAVLPLTLIGLHLIALGILAYDGLANEEPSREIAKRALAIATASFLVLMVSAEFAVRANSVRSLLIAVGGERDASSDMKPSLSEVAKTIAEEAANVHGSAFLQLLVGVLFASGLLLALRRGSATSRAKLLLVGAVVVVPPLLVIGGIGFTLSRTVAATMDQLRDPFESTAFPAVSEGGTAAFCKTVPVFVISAKDLQRVDGKAFPAGILDDAEGRKRALDFGDNWELKDRIIAGSRGGEITLATTSGLTFQRTLRLMSALVDARRKRRVSKEYWLHPSFMLRVSVGNGTAALASPFEVLTRPEACVALSVPLAPDLMDAEEGNKDKRPKAEEVAPIHLSVESWILSRPDQTAMSFVGDAKARAAQLKTALGGLRELRMTVTDEVPVDHVTLVASLAAALPDGRAVLDLSR